jgi:hypothetical protein
LQRWCTRTVECFACQWWSQFLDVVVESPQTNGSG